MSFQHRFNPCSYGSSVLTRKTFRGIVRSDGSFNPCSYGSSVLTNETYINKKGKEVRFQSLFLWIFRSYVQKKTTKLCPKSCFNPCSYGSSVLTDNGFLIKRKGTDWFQSLFLWIFRSYEKENLYISISKESVSILVLMDLPFLLPIQN